MYQATTKRDKKKKKGNKWDLVSGNSGQTCGPSSIQKKKENIKNSKCTVTVQNAQ
jgi:hypothetical protein